MKYAVAVTLKVCPVSSENNHVSTDMTWYVSDLLGCLSPIKAIATPFVSRTLAELECETWKRIAEREYLEQFMSVKVISMYDYEFITDAYRKNEFLACFSEGAANVISLDAYNITAFDFPLSAPEELALYYGDFDPYELGFESYELDYCLNHNPQVYDEVYY